jgi:hypothetical protein
MNEAQLKAIKVCIENGDKTRQKADDFYIAAGQHLKTLQAAHKERGGTWAEWEALPKEKCGIGESRASKLMQIAEKGNSEAIAQVQPTIWLSSHILLGSGRALWGSLVPDTSLIHKARARLVVDTDHKAVCGHEFIVPPTQH